MNAPECLEGLAKFRDPVATITKNHLVARDINSLCELEKHKPVAVNLSVTSLDPNLRRVLEATDAVLSCTPRCDQAVRAAKVPVDVISGTDSSGPHRPRNFKNSRHVRKSGMRQCVSPGVHRRAFPPANCLVPAALRSFAGAPVPVPRSKRYFGASEAAIASNLGSPRKGSHSGCRRK